MPNNPSKANKPNKAAKPVKTASEYFEGVDADCVKRWNRLTGAQRTAVDFTGLSLTGRHLSGINLNNVRARSINFDQATLSSSRLSGSFRNSTFVNADLSASKLIDGEFHDADLSRCKLTAADLTGTILSGACLKSADLSHAVLKGTVLSGADLTEAQLTDVVWERASFDKNTRWPIDFAIPGELTWSGTTTDPRFSGKGKSAFAADINGLLARLHQVINAARMTRTLDMLKKEKHQLYSEVESTFVRGIVQSHTRPDLVYSCVLTEDGRYSCMDQHLSRCFGLDKEPCKHLLTLVIGLAKAGTLDPQLADRWMLAASKRGPSAAKPMKNHISDSLLKYKGVEAGEIDWRPTETIPEDFYTL
ncbi:MAG: pentapeptide repeat-containing protein [Pirellulaceae bacterium]|nr:pentapeptide repeat-containing protein [Pirellulaceae bacterium]